MNNENQTQMTTHCTNGNHAAIHEDIWLAKTTIPTQSQEQNSTPVDCNKKHSAIHEVGTTTHHHGWHGLSLFVVLHSISM